MEGAGATDSAGAVTTAETGAGETMAMADGGDMGATAADGAMATEDGGKCLTAFNALSKTWTK